MMYDNCKNCVSHCEHAGKDREFVCIHGVSCKVEYSRDEMEIPADDVSLTNDMIRAFIENRYPR